MKLSYELLNEEYHIQNGQILFLCIENLNEYRRLLNNLYFENNTLAFYEGLKEIPKKQIEFIENTYSINLNSTYLQKKLYTFLEEEMKNEFNLQNTLELNSLIINKIQYIVYESEFDIETDTDVNLSLLLKACGVKIIEDWDSELEHLIEYIRLNLKFYDTKVFLFSMLSNNFNSEELTTLANFSKIQNIALISLERYEPQVNIGNNKILLFDNDLCRVL